MQRQAAVLAYQYGITNPILPSHAVLIGALGLTRVPLSKWFRYIWLLLTLIARPYDRLVLDIQSLLLKAASKEVLDAGKSNFFSAARASGAP
jgi:uncharacterized ion transporter superfamily protein YfcC